MSELFAEVLDAGRVNLEEEIGLGLLGKTHPAMNESKWIRSRILWPYRISPWTLLRSNGAEVEDDIGNG